MSGTPAPGAASVLSRVLLLEDHPLQHVMLRDGLACRLGERASVCACHRLDEALAALADGTFDALFTDWALPGGTAAPAISRFRERFPAAPIIVYTAHVENAAAAELGAHAVYDKADRRAGRRARRVRRAAGGAERAPKRLTRRVLRPHRWRGGRRRLAVQRVVLRTPAKRG